MIRELNFFILFLFLISSVIAVPLATDTTGISVKVDDGSGSHKSGGGGGGSHPVIEEVVQKTNPRNTTQVIPKKSEENVETPVQETEEKENVIAEIIDDIPEALLWQFTAFLMTSLLIGLIFIKKITDNGGK